MAAISDLNLDFGDPFDGTVGDAQSELLYLHWLKMRDFMLEWGNEQTSLLREAMNGMTPGLNST